MKLAEYLPEVPQIAQQMSNLNQQINMLELMKGTGETGQAPTFGVDPLTTKTVLPPATTPTASSFQSKYVFPCASSSL